MADSLVVDTERKEKFWISYIKRRNLNKKNFLCCITGPTGSGKSWSALSICNQVDPSFNPSRIVFSMKELMNLVNRGDLKSGSAILWDEAGIDLSNRNWQSLVNKSINYLLQTFRHKRLVLIFTVPYMDFLDTNSRKLFHAEILTQKINFKKKVVKTKAYLMQYNPRNKKFYYKYLRVKTKKGIAPITIYNIEAPPTWLIDSYEDLKTKFTSKLNLDIEQQLKEAEPSNEIKPLTSIQEEVIALMSEGNKVSDVALKMGLKERTIYFHLAQSKKKGYTMEDYS